MQSWQGYFVLVAVCGRVRQRWGGVGGGGGGGAGGGGGGGRGQGVCLRGGSGEDGGVVVGWGVGVRTVGWMFPLLDAWFRIFLMWHGELVGVSVLDRVWEPLLG